MMRHLVSKFLLFCTGWAVGVAGLTVAVDASERRLSKKTRPPLLHPSWKSKSIPSWSPNLSILSDYRFRSSSRFDWMRDLMDPGVARQIEKKYEDIDRDYEYRERHGLLQPHEYEGQRARYAELRQEAMEEVRNRQRRKQLGNLRHALEKDPNLRRPVSVAVALAAVATGTPLQTSLGESAKITLAANVPFQTSYLRVESWLGESRFTTVGNPDAGGGSLNAVFPGLLPGPPDWVPRQEHYAFSFSRPLPVWGLGTGVVYGGTSNTISASLSKQLTESLNCSFNSVQPIDSEAGVDRPSQESVRLDYKVEF